MKAKLVAILLALPLSAHAEASNWAASPGPAELAAVWPAKAASQGIGGRAAMECAVDAKGALADCRLIAEAPSAMGFGAALLGLAPRYRLKPDKTRREAPDGRIRIAETWSTADRHADWRRRPTPADLLAVWPKQAWIRQQSGHAIISCLVAAQGGLYDCLVLSESPQGANFGAAAISLTPQLLFHPPLRKGQPVLDSVSIPVRFEFPQGVRQPQDDCGMSASLDATISWDFAPTAADVLAAYPPAARAKKIGGHATVNCHVAKEGGLRGCAVVGEEPKGLGVGKAARQLAETFRVNLGDASARALNGASVTIPVTFDPATLGAATVSGKPIFTRMPDAAALSAATRMLKPGVEVGRSTLSCRVEQGGGLAECSVVSEDPAGQGAAAAALSMKTGLKLATWTTEGLPVVGTRISVPLRFNVETVKAPGPTP